MNKMRPSSDFKCRNNFYEVTNYVVFYSDL